MTDAYKVIDKLFYRFAISLTILIALPSTIAIAQLIRYHTHFTNTDVVPAIIIMIATIAASLGLAEMSRRSHNSH